MKKLIALVSRIRPTLDLKEMPALGIALIHLVLPNYRLLSLVGMFRVEILGSGENRR